MWRIHFPMPPLPGTGARTVHDLLRCALDEIAIEGRQGCTLPRLWALLELEPSPAPSSSPAASPSVANGTTAADRDDLLRNAIWRAIAARSSEIKVEIADAADDGAAAATAATAARTMSASDSMRLSAAEAAAQGLRLVAALAPRLRALGVTSPDGVPDPLFGALEQVLSW